MNPIPKSRCSVLYIDDEEKALKYFRMALSSKFTVFTASSGEEGLAILRKEAGNIGVVISDQRMPGLMGADVLGIVRQEFPQTVRILTTAYSDLESAILAVNQGFIYQYVVKPWDVTELEMVLQRATDYFQIVSERNELLRLKMSTLQRIICCDRVKWLLLTFGAGSGPSECAFRQALFSLLRSLGGLSMPAPSESHVFRTDEFDVTTLIHQELHVGMPLKEMLSKEQESGTILPACSPVSELGESGKTLASELSRFVSFLPDDVGTSVLLGEGVEVTLSPSSPRFAQNLNGVLLAREPDEPSKHLLGLVWSFAQAGIPLRLLVEQPGSAAVTISLTQDAISSDDILEALRSVFERWDVSAL